MALLTVPSFLSPRRHQDAMILQWIFHKLQTIISISTDSATDTFAKQLENPYRSPSLYRTQKMCHLPPRLQAATGSAPPVTGCTTLDQTKQHWNPSGTNWITESIHTGDTGNPTPNKTHGISLVQ